MKLMKSSIAAIIGNIEVAEEYLVEEMIEEFEECILEPTINVFVYGAGRSGLVARAFATRLVHLGINTYVVGETITPKINEEDCLIVVSGSGETCTVVSAVKNAKNIGSKVLALTSFPDSSIGRLADVMILVKGRTKIEAESEDYLKRQMDGNFDSLLTPLGTAFELTAHVFLEGIISELMAKKGLAEEDLNNNHNILE